MISFDKYRDLPIRLTKIKDVKFENKHPNGINEGYVKEGIIDVEKSNEHQCFLIIKNERFFNTSQVLEIDEQSGYDLVHTVNSIYKVEPIFSGLTGTQEKHSAGFED